MQAQELFYIFIIALVVLGPQRMPVVAKKLGKWAYELRKAASDLRSGLEAEVGDLSEIRRDFVDPVKRAQDDVRAPLRELKRDVEKPIMEMKNASDAAVTGAAAVVKRASYEPKKPSDVEQGAPNGSAQATSAPEGPIETPRSGPDAPSKPLRWIGPQPETEPTPAAPLRWIGPDPVSGPTAGDAAQDFATIEATGGAVTDDPGLNGTEPG